MRKELETLRAEALERIAAARTEDELQEIRVRLFGKKGALTRLMKRLGTLPPEERPRSGELVNEARSRLEAVWEEKSRLWREAALAARLREESIDITLPGTIPPPGRRHPLNMVIADMENIFLGMGFSIAEGPEIETDYYNFEAMNMPPDHPARDMQDSFYISEEFLLRTQTSPVQIRSMEKTCPRLPVKVIAPGKVYRNDDDATHSPMFHQVEGLLVDRGVRMSDLKGVLLHFIREMFGPEREIRLRPSFFPFTEPSAEIDVSCMFCGGAGCRLCKGTGWIEILGAGMVHPQVLRMGGYDAGAVTGFAFGVGVERVAMLKYGIDDMRLLFDNDIRFLRQF
ncbi:MAG: phenylalanine--tRNA ligase subunit alpha [Gracilibacteraceae bacterium]|jgi:phenylalanyl-tRNA synthetase alpha chain|nr:phenylalanine--tRNA ligase subunit alpha [Gracilibacteraceae bacterium]